MGVCKEETNSEWYQWRQMYQTSNMKRKMTIYPQAVNCVMRMNERNIQRWKGNGDLKMGWAS